MVAFYGRYANVQSARSPLVLQADMTAAWSNEGVVVRRLRYADFFVFKMMSSVSIVCSETVREP